MSDIELFLSQARVVQSQCDYHITDLYISLKLVKVIVIQRFSFVEEFNNRFSVISPKGNIVIAFNGTALRNIFLLSDGVTVPHLNYKINPSLSHYLPLVV